MAKDPTNKQLHDLISKRFETTNEKLVLMLTQLTDVQDDVRLLRKIQNEHSERFDEIQSTLDAVSRAIDKDAVTLISHGRRLARLERGHS